MSTAGTQTSAAATAAPTEDGTTVKASPAPAPAPSPAPTAATPSENKTSGPSEATAASAAAAAAAAVKGKDAIKIIKAVKQEEAPKDPSKPTDRDVVMDQEQMQGTALLFDLIRFHYYLWYVNNEGDGHEASNKEKNNEAKTTMTTKESVPTDPSQVDDLAKHLVKLMTDGKPYCLVGLHDVPRPFLVGKGRYFKKDPRDAEKYIRVEKDEEILNYVATTILAQFKALSQTPPPEKVVDAIKTLYRNTDPSSKKAEKETAKAGKDEEGTVTTTSSCVGPRPVDVLLVPIDADQEDIVAYDQQTGNKRLLHIASQLVSGAGLAESEKRVIAAVTLTTSQADVEEADGKVVQKTPRFVLQNISSASSTSPSSSSWRELDYKEMAEVATMFVYEIYREKGLNFLKRLYDKEDVSSTGHQDGVAPGTSTEGIEHPTTHDVLFGRGTYPSLLFIFSSRCQYPLFSFSSELTHSPVETSYSCFSIFSVMYSGLYWTGGMTNGHPGNRRFRDLIALHRPDYMGAQKTEKPVSLFQYFAFNSFSSLMVRLTSYCDCSSFGLCCCKL